MCRKTQQRRPKNSKLISNKHKGFLYQQQFLITECILRTRIVKLVRCADDVLTTKRRKIMIELVKEFETDVRKMGLTVNKK